MHMRTRAHKHAEQKYMHTPTNKQHNDILLSVIYINIIGCYHWILYNILQLIIELFYAFKFSKKCAYATQIV